MNQEGKKFELEIGKEKLVVEIRNLAEQASGSVFVKYGETVVLTTAVAGAEAEAIDFFPLTVDYEERFYAAGKIRGPRYIKRETRPSDEAICNARLIDRAIRPLFPEGFDREVQVVTTVLSWDGKNDPDVLGVLGASLALLISDIPWTGPVGVLRVGLIDDNFIINPSYEEKQKGKMDLVISGVERNGEILVNMLEGGFEEVEDEKIVEAFLFSKPWIKKLIDFQLEIQKAVGKEKIPLKEERLDPEIEKEFLELFDKKLEIALFQPQKNEAKEKLTSIREEVIEFIEKRKPEAKKLALKLFKKRIEKILQKNIIEKEKRPDGRRLDEIREIHCEISVLPRTHGSALFCRGQTKSLSILTLGAPGDVQLLEGMEIVGKKRFMHHYNFPPYAAGEVKPIKGPGRREIGHGVLVERALLPIIPSFDDFPYTIRIVSEILSSNGSTSMASCCSSSLALMDAGVPIKAAVAGIALGLIMDENGNYKVLTDIQGPEDQNGDMDFKLAGTKRGATACQMDVKIAGISEKILRECIERSKKARMEILEIMERVIAEPKKELSPFAPRVFALQINPEKIREVIGPGGKTINEIISECGVSIDIEENGKIFVTAEKEDAAKKAVSWIKNITREIKIGEVFQGKVKRILNFGAIIEILPGQEGLLHISQLKGLKGKRLDGVLKIGEIVPVKVIAIDELGRISLGLQKPKKLKPLYR
jgi:polyribonucleotide nucleotidyltransferase